MIEGYIGPIYQRWFVAPLINFLNRWPFWTPTFFTACAVGCGLLCLILLGMHHPLSACICLWLSGYFDTLDGSLARFQQRDCASGAVIDIIADRCVESMVMIGLYWIDPFSRGFAIVAMFSSTLLCVTSFLVVAIFVTNTQEKSFHYSRGLMERPEAFAFYTLMMLAPKYFTLWAWAYSVLVLFTAGLRIYQFFQSSNKVTSYESVIL